VRDEGDGGGRGDWWRHHDGRWYPPASARHPAAKGTGPAAAEDGNGSEHRDLEIDLRHTGGRVWLLWATVLVPLLLVAGIVAALLGLSTGARLGHTEMAGDPGQVTVTTPATSTTAPDTAAPAPVTTAPPTSPPATVPPSTTDHTPTASPPSAVPAGPAPSSAGGDAATPSPAPADDPPRAPANVDECKDGGWVDLVDDSGQPFANQGDCVAYVSVHSSWTTAPG
jgi:hypothetical protein